MAADLIVRHMRDAMPSTWGLALERAHADGWRGAGWVFVLFGDWAQAPLEGGQQCVGESGQDTGRCRGGVDVRQCQMPVPFSPNVGEVAQGSLGQRSKVFAAAWTFGSWSCGGTGGVRARLVADQ